MYQYGGARAGYLPDGKANPKNKSASPSRIADPLTGQRVVTRVDSVDSFDITSQQERDNLLSNGAYTGGDVGFRALTPGAGDTDFIRYFNSGTGAHGFSAAAGDVQFFTSRGYVIDGVAWRI